MYKITRETGPSLLTEAPTYIKREASGCFVLCPEAGTLDPVTAGEHESLFAEWAWPVSYKTGQIRRFGGAFTGRCVIRSLWPLDRTSC